MKKQLKAALAAALALFMALAVLPTSALPRFDAKAEGEPEPGWTVPAGYNEYDYNKCAAFLEQTDENGVKNGEKMGSSYDPNDPGTWVWGFMKSFSWIEVNGEQRVRSIQLYESNLCGGLDLSGCTSLDYLQFNRNSIIELDVTGCTALEYLYCHYNNLTEVDVTSCSALRSLGCGSNNLTELDVTQNPALYSLNCPSNNLTELDVTQNPALVGLVCSSNNLTELDVTQNPALWDLSCSSNNLTELDLSNNQDLPYDHIRAEGSGFVGCDFSLYDGIICAYPMNGVVFEGFYDENGELVSEGEWDDSLKAYKYGCQYFEEKPTGTINARFSILGDINGDGEVTPMDALLLMRFCMGVLDEDQVDLRRADVNGDGVVDLMDANTVLRITIGLE